MSRPSATATPFAASGAQPAGAGTHEAVIAPLLGWLPLTFLCLYDRSAMDDAAIAAVTALHERDRARPGVFDDGVLRVTSPGPARVHLAGELDYDNHHAVRAAVDQAQASAAASGAVLELDLASLRFADVAGLRTLRTATRAGPTIRLVRMQPMIRRILDLIDPAGVDVVPGAGRGRPAADE